VLAVLALWLIVAAEPAQAAGPERVSTDVAHSSPSGPGTVQHLPLGWRAAMLERVNALRATVGAPALLPCAALRRSAQDYAGTMATTSTFAHVGPDGSQPWDRMKRQGYAWRTAAENIAAGQSRIADVMDAWVHSPGHYENLVNPDLRQVGFGYAYDPDSAYGAYWVQDFGSGRGC
jgi:uncharacterized protein YkwD